MPLPLLRLTAKQEAFVNEYVKDGNATAAVIRAGYDGGNATAWATSLRKLPQVQAAIDRLRKETSKRNDLSISRIVEEYRRIALADARTLHDKDGRLLQPHEWDDETAAQIAGIEVSSRRVSAGTGTSSGLSADADRALVGGVAQVQVEERTIKVKRWDKLRALDKLAEYVGMTSHSPSPSLDSLTPEALDKLSDDELAELYTLTDRITVLTTNK